MNYESGEKIFDLSLDIETLALEDEAVILSVAIVGSPFTDSGAIFYSHLDIEYQMFKLQRTVTADTLRWWMDTNDELFVSTLRTCLAYGLAPDEFFARMQNYFFGYNCRVWMNPPRFDADILENLAKQMGTKLPWTFRDESDLRTLRALAQEKSPALYATLPPKPIGAHDALVDATYQLEIVKRCKSIINPAGE